MDQWMNVNIAVCGYSSSKRSEPGGEADENKGPFCLPEFLTVSFGPSVLVLVAWTLEQRQVRRHREPPQMGLVRQSFAEEVTKRRSHSHQMPGC